MIGINKSPLNFKRLVPLLILGLLCFFTVVYNTLTGIPFFLQNYLAFELVAACFTSYFYFRRFYKYVILVTLFLGLINILDFTPFSTSTNLWFVGWKVRLIVQFQPITFLIIVITYVVNFRNVNSKLGRLLDIIMIEFFQRSPVDVENFKNQYKGKSTEELEQMLRTNDYEELEKEAARQLLKDRFAEAEAIK